MDYLTEGDIYDDESLFLDDAAYFLDDQFSGGNEDEINNYMENNNLHLIWKYCVVPSIIQVVRKFYPIVIVAILTRFVQTSRTFSRFDLKWKHIISISMSLVVLLMFFPIYLLLFFISLVLCAAFLILKSSANLKIYTIVLCGIYLIIGQISMDKETWLSIRGAAMILIMKIVSLAFEISHIDTVNIWSILDYLVCVYSSILGPWISYRQFLDTYMGKGFSIGIKPVKYAVLCLFSLSLSNCLFNLIESHIDENRILTTYFKAFSFRQSHYFICYFCQFICSIGNLRSVEDRYRKKSGENEVNVDRTLLLTRQFEIELPRSLLHVVTNWNLPMHFWLKKYVFIEAKKYGIFVAIFTTYFISSLLHGFDLNIVLVLFSLGLFTYVELNFRLRLSRILNSCTEVRDCPKACHHKHKKDSLFTKLVNSILLAINLWHLAYLGQLFYFESEHPSESTINLALSKWSKTYYSSHIFVIIQLFISKIF